VRASVQGSGVADRGREILERAVHAVSEQAAAESAVVDEGIQGGARRIVPGSLVPPPLREKCAVLSHEDEIQPRQDPGG
jgi:hypothetical protein